MFHQIQKASDSREWQRLLHYRPSFMGRSYSILKGTNYFLADDGSTDPAAELQASLEILFNKNPELQCRYLARTDFIVRQWPELSKKVVPCAFFEEWKKKLGVNQVSLIFATSYLNNAASSFGHTFLRLENPKNILRGELLDYGINFSARTENTGGALYALYGLFGYFPGRFAMLPYHQLIKEYTNLEGRDLWEYRLNFSEVEVERLLKYLLEMENTYIDYYFLDDNCSYQVLWALQVARPTLDLALDDEPWVIPLDSVKVIERAHLMTSKEYRPSLARQWQERLQALDSEEKSQLHELLQKISDPKEELEISASAEVIEAAQVYADLKSDEDQDRKKKKSFVLARRRAQLPKTSELKIPVPTKSPDQTHDSFNMGFGQGSRDHESYQAFHVDPAFHAWLSDDRGVSPFSELQLFHFEIRNYSGQLRLEKWVPLKILSTHAVDRFFQPVSWGAELSYDHYLLAPDVARPSAKGQVGYSFDFFGGTRLMGFLYAGIGRSLEENTIGFYGPELRVLNKIGERFRWGLIGRMEVQSSTTPLTEVAVESTWDLSTQWELRFFHRTQSLHSSSEDLGLGVHRSF